MSLSGLGSRVILLYKMSWGVFLPSFKKKSLWRIGISSCLVINRIHQWRNPDLEFPLWEEFFTQHFIMRNFKHTVKLKIVCEYQYNHHLDSVIYILLYHVTWSIIWVLINPCCFMYFTINCIYYSTSVGSILIINLISSID